MSRAAPTDLDSPIGFAPPTGFDAIAPIYRWLEYALFAGGLQRCRTAYLPLPADVQSILAVGDGDGRFLASALRIHPTLQAVSIDASETMLNLARQRCAFAGDRTTFKRKNLLADPADAGAPEPLHADLIASHFFFDCFCDGDLSRVVERITQLAPTARYWIVSEFAVPSHWPARWLGKALVNFLYAFFRRTTHISARALPDHRALLRQQNFQLKQTKAKLGGILIAESWERDSN